MEVDAEDFVVGVVVRDRVIVRIVEVDSASVAVDNVVRDRVIVGIFEVCLLYTSDAADE